MEPTEICGSATWKTLAGGSKKVGSAARNRAAPESVEALLPVAESPS